MQQKVTAQYFENRLTPTALRWVTQQIKKHPNDVYWRARMVIGSNSPTRSRPRARKLAFESALIWIEHDPVWFAYRSLPTHVVGDWSMREAQQLVDAFSIRNRHRESWIKGSFWWLASVHSDDKLGFLEHARSVLETIPPAARGKEYFERMAQILAELDIKQFAATVKTFLNGLDFTSPIIGHTLLDWLRRFHAAEQTTAYEIVSRRFAALPPELRNGRDSVAFEDLEGRIALTRGDLKRVRIALKRMTGLAREASFLGNDDTLSLARALAKTGTLRKEVSAYVAATLSSDWRSWVRPKLEKLLKSVSK